MRIYLRHSLPAVFGLSGLAPGWVASSAQTTAPYTPTTAYHASALCYACHDSLKDSKGEDASIGSEWRASIMANASRDPYWLASLRRETLDHPESSTEIQNECSNCHMPVQRLRDKSQGHDTDVFSYLPFPKAYNESSAPADGVSCAVCHQIQPTGLGTTETSNGNFPIAPLEDHERAVYGPFAASSDQASQTHVATTGYGIRQSAHIDEAGLCATCHTLTTVARDRDGKEIGRLPEQMVFAEWSHSDYRNRETCQQCHMPRVGGSVPLASIMSSPREGVHRHTFTGANFLMESMLEAHRDEMGVIADASDLSKAATAAKSMLQSRSARLSLISLQLTKTPLAFSVRVENLTGHKFPTSFPSRRAWLHVLVTSSDGSLVFESGKMAPDGSIVGNPNDMNPDQFAPHYLSITKPDQVQIFESILGDANAHVTTGLLSAVRYLKDNRILPTGFEKESAPAEVAVHGKAAVDPNFVGGSSTTRYMIGTKAAKGPFQIVAELIYQPIGYRWAHNFDAYKVSEPERFVSYYNEAASNSAFVLARVVSDSHLSHK